LKRPTSKNPGTPELRRAIGAALREIRTRHGYTQESLARHAFCDRSQITRVEMGHYNPTYAWLARIMQALDEDMVRFARLVKKYLQSTLLLAAMLVLTGYAVPAAHHTPHA
jgi:transcriptional regulator with XRE-family HTH domain